LGKTQHCLHGLANILPDHFDRARFNALTERLEVEIKRNGKVYQMQFANGEKQSELSEIGTVGKANTGTMVHFWPDASNFY
jgi:DNA gyrase/topoisomerase IV subunit B